MDFVIERGVAMPPRQRRKLDYSYPFGSMRVGDSFVIPLNGHTVQQVRNDLYNQASVAGVNVKTREVPKGTLRVWRVL